MRSAVALRAVGHAAHRALAASGGRLDSAPAPGSASYARVNGALVWLGHGSVAMHPRAIVLQAPARLHAGDRLDVRGLLPWHPLVVPAGASAASIRARCAALARNLRCLARPQGFAVMLRGELPAFPLERAAARVRAFACALDADDPLAVRDAALPLLGLGPGLTPSGDDLVGAALFARRMLAPARASDVWECVTAQLIDAASERSHPIAAALFRDLAMLQTFAPLHRLAAGLAAQADDEEIVGAARALVAIGHSSGWEMLAGFMLGVAGTSLLPRSGLP
jgi:hypothetical protein